MIIFEGIFKLVGYCERNRPLAFVPEEIIDKAAEELTRVQALRQQAAEMRRLMQAVIDRQNHKLDTEKPPFKYTPAWRELALMAEWLKEHPE